MNQPANQDGLSSVAILYSMPGHCAQQLSFVPALEDWGVYVMTSHLMMLQLMTRQLITSSSGFKEENGCRCRARARTHEKHKGKSISLL